MTRLIKSGQIVPTVASYPEVIGFWPCFQANTDTQVIDRSGTGNNLTFGAGLTTGEAWANANTFSTVDSTAQDDAVFPSVASFSYDFNAGENLLIAFRVLAAAPAATRTIIGNGYNSTTAQGLRLIIKSTGVMAPWIYQAGGDKFLSDTPTAVADGTTKHVVFAWFGHDVAAGTASYMIWINGVRAYSTNTATTGLTTMTPVDPLRVGGNKTGAASFQSMTARFSCLHMYRSASDVRLTLERLDDVALRLFRSPSSMLTRSEWVG